MGYGGECEYAWDPYGEADADPRPAEQAKSKEAEFIATERRGMAADAYADIARRLKELQAERGE